MALTNKLGIVVDCYPNSSDRPDMEIFEFAERELIDSIRSLDLFPKDRPVRILDIGSGKNGSGIVNSFGGQYPNTEIVYLDKEDFLLKELDKQNKVLANATNIPFADETFDICYAGHIISEGVVKNHWLLKDDCYKIAKEGYRVLKKNGGFVFTYCMGNDIQTLTNLNEIGYRKLQHLQRIKWFGGIPTDTYLSRK